MTKLFVWLAFMSAIVEEAIKGLFHAYEKPDISKDETQPVKADIIGCRYYPFQNPDPKEVEKILNNLDETQPVKVCRYTAEQIRPKRYPNEKPTLVNKRYWNSSPPSSEYSRSWDSLKYFENGDWGLGYDVDWFIDVADAPEELKPLAYPENKPSRLGAYIIHRTTSDVWMPVNWMSGWCMGFSDCIVEIADVDYYIPYRLESEE